MFWIDAKSAASGFAAAASILVLAGGAGARELHVSPKEIEGFAGQHRTIQEVAKAARAGDTVVLHAGTYREYVLVDKGGSKINPVRFAAATGEKVVVTGADLLQELRRCVFQDNGQLGFGACRAHDMLITGCLVRNNNVKDYNRGWEAGGDKLVLCRGAVIEKSQFVGNRGNGIWFDINDGRHWPKAMQGAEYGGPAPEDIAAAYGAKDDANKPVGLSLEKLNLRFEKNLYYAAPGQGLVNWGVTWKKHERYATLEAVAKALALETRSRVERFEFGDFLTRDFRVPSSSPALRMRCYPRGDVPGVMLGTMR